MNTTGLLKDELIKLLQGGSAHATLDDALENIPDEARGKRPHGLPYSIWQLAEHIRIAQWDMLEFCKDVNHQSPKWPDDYWPENSEPDSDAVWNHTVKQITDDRDEFVDLLKNGDLFEKLPHGQGQTLLREALQMADHTSYHTSEIIILRRLLNCWKS